MLRLLRMRLPWCELVRWVAYRFATYMIAASASAGAKQQWEQVATDIRTGKLPYLDACGGVVDELRDSIAARKFVRPWVKQ